MNCILTFMNSHLMLHSTNRVALVAAHATGQVPAGARIRILCPSDPEAECSNSDPDPT